MIFLKLYQQIKVAITDAEFVTMQMQVQNYDLGMRTYRQFIVKFQEIVGELAAKKKELEENQILLEFSYVLELLKGAVFAQEQKDYVLLSDILQIQITPLLYQLQQELLQTYPYFYREEIFTQNVEALRNVNPQLSNLIEGRKSKFFQMDTFPNFIWKEGDTQISYLIEAARSGHPILRMENIQTKAAYYLHSNQNPVQEALCFSKQYFDAKAENYHLLGLGLGYHALALLEDCYFSKNVFVYEPDLNVLVLAFCFVSLENYLGKSIFVDYDPELIKMADALKIEGNQLIIHHPSLNQIQNPRLQRKLEEFFLEENSLRNGEKILSCNFYQNMKAAKQKGLELITEKEQFDFKGKDLYVIAAGPSLDVNLDQLLERPKNSIVIAMGTVFRKLMKKGIRPDYVMITDPNNRVISQITGLEGENIPLLLLSTANYQFHRYYRGPIKFLFQKGYPIALEYLNQMSGSKSPFLIETGGSVATACLDFAIQLNPARIIFLGLDLAYTNQLAHATDTSQRLSANQEDLIPVPSFDGGIVYSDEKFNLFRHFIEERLEQEDAKKNMIINATEGGSLIKGMEYRSLLEVIKSTKQGDRV